MFESRRTRWRAIFTYVLVIASIAALLIVALNTLIASTLYQLARDTARSELAAAVTRSEWAMAWANGPAAIAEQLRQWPIRADDRVAALSPSGDVIAETQTSGRGSLAATPEVRAALSSGYGLALRTDETGFNVVYAAQRFEVDGQVVGVLYKATNLQAVDATVQRLQGQIALAVSLAAALLIIFIVFQVERAGATLRRLTALVERALINKFDGHVLSFPGGEVGELTNAVNMLIDKYRKAVKRRARERDRLHTLMTHMTSGALILNEQGRVRLLNPAAESILHTTAEKAIRKSFVQVAWDYRIAEVWQRCQQNSREETETIELGSDRLLRVTAAPFNAGDANGYLVMMQDLTQMRRLEKMRRDFVSNVSHELRTPLASLTALVDTLRDGALDDPPAATRFLDRMEIEVDKMAQMVQELLELSRIESGQVPMRFEPTSVAAVIQPAVERLAMQAERGGLTIEVALPTDLPQVIADVERVQQVMINLLHNAIKFTPSGGHIVVRAGCSDAHAGMMVVSVTDTGVGIPKDDCQRIFERFYKADRSRSGGGTGLGLAIAKHTVQMHNGRIWVESVEGKGSTFFFTLPLVNHPFTQS